MSPVVRTVELPGRLTLPYVEHHPERTLALVLAASFSSYRYNPVVAELWESGMSALTDPIDPAFVRGSRRARWPGRCLRRSSTPSSRKA